MPPSSETSHDIEELRASPAFTILKFVAAITWGGTVVFIYFYAYHHGLTFKELLVDITTFLESSPWAPLFFILVYIVQPFAFLPSGIFTVLAGSIFGFWYGYIYTFIGAVLSAALVYITGRFLTHRQKLPHLVTRFSRPLHNEPFLTMLFMRLAYFPFDVVNFSAGLLKMRFRPFIFATALGILPGIATLTALGAAFSPADFIEHGFSLKALDMRALVISAVFFLVTLLAVKVIRPYISLKK